MPKWCSSALESSDMCTFVQSLSSFVVNVCSDLFFIWVYVEEWTIFSTTLSKQTADIHSELTTHPTPTLRLALRAHWPCSIQAAASVRTQPLCASQSWWWTRRPSWRRKPSRWRQGWTARSEVRYTGSTADTGNTEMFKKKKTMLCIHDSIWTSGCVMHRHIQYVAHTCG